MQQLPFPELGGAFGSNQSALDGLVANPLDTDASAVIGDFDDHVAAFLIGAQAQCALRIFARRGTDLGGFDAMVE